MVILLLLTTLAIALSLIFHLDYSPFKGIAVNKEVISMKEADEQADE